MTEDAQSDEELVTAFLQGNESAMDALLLRYQEPLWRFARKLSNHKDEPFIDDIRQQVLLAIFKDMKAGKFEPTGPGSFRAWAYLVTRHKCIDANRHLKHQPQTFTERYSDSASGGPDDLMDDRPQPADYDEAQQEVDKLLAGLSAQDKQLLLLIVENKTYEEIHQIPPFDKETLANLRQKTCRLRRIMVVLLKNKNQ